jgi:hypothetical protein
MTLCGGIAAANDMYMAQNAAGPANGSSCATAYAVSFFNTSGNWGSGASQIGPGTTVHLCGTISAELQVQASGVSGRVIEILWESGAKISLPVGSAIALNGHSYLLFDGGAACGPSTACSSNDSGTGIIENTDNGSQLANHSNAVAAFDGSNGSGNIEIRNLIIRNLYQHTLPTDQTNSIDTGTYVILCALCSGNLTVHDSTFHDLGTGIRVETTTNSPAFNFYNLYFYNDNWGFENSGDGARTFNAHDIHFGSTTNWDTNSDAFHHNGFHFYMNVPADSLATNLYNNLSDGNWGACCTTATQLFVETDLPNNFNVFNNVAIQYAGNTAPAWEYGATNGAFVNNTAVGVASTPSNVAPIQLYGTGINFQNNSVEGYGQHIYVHSGTTFTGFDYNQWGAIGSSGNAPWQYGTIGASTFSAWQTACSCDSHGGNPAHLGVNITGIPQVGSGLISTGANLTGLGLAALDFDTSAGNTRTSVARPASGPWTAGAYQYLGSPIFNPPPSLLTAVGH